MDENEDIVDWSNDSIQERVRLEQRNAELEVAYQNAEEQRIRLEEVKVQLNADFQASEEARTQCEEDLENILETE